MRKRNRASSGWRAWGLFAVPGLAWLAWAAPGHAANLPYEDGRIYQCSDDVDNDSDGLVDWYDPGCWTDPGQPGPGTYDRKLDDESVATSRCQNGVDDDVDGPADYPADDGCSSPQDNDENPFVYDQVLGQQRTAVILAHKPGETTLGKTPGQVYEDLLDLSKPAAFNHFILETTYGKTWLTGWVYGWYEIPDPGFITIQDCIVAADDDINYTQVDRVICITPGSATTVDCMGGGGQFEPLYVHTDEGYLGFVGAANTFNAECLNGEAPDFSRARYLAGEGSYHLLSHEVGHTLRLVHARNYNCGSVAYSPDPEDCEIGSTDSFDQVGTGKGHYGAVNKEKDGWFHEGNVVEVFESGTYMIRPFEITTSEPLVLKIPRVECEPPYGDLGDPCGGDGRGWYYLEYRRRIGQDSGLWNFYNIDGALFRIDGFQRLPWPDDAGQLRLDMDPSVGSSITLEQGRAFLDPHRRTTIRTLDVSENGLLIEVKLSKFGVCGDDVVNGGEQCDDGNRENHDACLDSCHLPFCGDGFIRPVFELCDDANTDTGDGCSQFCFVEPGWTCSGEPSVCEPLW